MEENRVTIELTQEEVNVFKFTQANYKNLLKLEEKGVFRIKSRTVTLHIDHSGLIQDIDVTIRLK